MLTKMLLPAFVAYSAAPTLPASKPLPESANLWDIVLKSAPIEPSWVLEGDPQARSGLHSRSADGAATTTVWDCTAGRFRWHFGWDETVLILDGSVRVTDESGGVRTIAAGDVAYFAAGTWAEWEIERYVRKLAFCRREFPAPVVAVLGLRDRLRAFVKRAG